MRDVKPGRILVVDDEVSQMKALCDTLRDQGYETAGFDTGRAALDELERTKFDLLITDLTMPGMDGIALLQAAQRVDPEIAGVIMTGNGSIGTAVEALKVGALDYILKPFKLSIILPVISRALTMRHLRLENGVLERQLRERADELEAANKELEAFSYSVSHDLRAPLRIIDGYCHMLEEDLGDKLDESSRGLIQVVRDSSTRMGGLIEDLLAFSKFGRKLMTAARIDMNTVVAEAWREALGTRPPGVPDFRLHPLPAAWGDRALIKQVWMNLLSNALKYSAKKDKPVIEVRAEARESTIVYCVEDNGAGFDMRYKEKLFGVFQRLHSEGEFSGTGIGLAIVQRVVVRHGGRVWAESTVGEGATFFFCLPGLGAVRNPAD